MPKGVFKPTPFGEPFTLEFKKNSELFDVWYRSNPNGFWHLYDHSQFYLWEKQTPNLNAGGGKYFYTMLRKLHFMKCGNSLSDSGEFKPLGTKLIAKDAVKRHRICKKCYKMAKAKLKEAGVFKAHSKASSERMDRRWAKWHEEHDPERWENK